MKRNGILLIVLLISSVWAYAVPYPTYLVVSKDTSEGDFTSIQEAVNSCKSFPDVRITIFVKKGIYKEKVEINSWNTRITLLGEDKENTILTWDDAAGKKKNGTFWTYTLKVLGNDFRMENLTVENTAGQVGQAVALHVEADRVVVKNCKILGNQDTLYAAGENARQLYDSCYIDGTTDYIFGPGTAVFRNCIIHSKKNSYITAASTPERVRYGYVFLKCKLTYKEDITDVYLGRPWRKYAHTVFIQCDLGDKINPKGWREWSNKENPGTTYYAEYQCSGAGANRKERVEWSYELTKEEVAQYTIDNIFSGVCDVTTGEKSWYNE